MKHVLHIRHVPHIPAPYIPVKRSGFMKHVLHIRHAPHIPAPYILVKRWSCIKHPIHQYDISYIPVIQWLIKWRGAPKQAGHVSNVTYIPVIYRFIKSFTFFKHTDHRNYPTQIGRICCRYSQVGTTMECPFHAGPCNSPPLIYLENLVLINGYIIKMDTWEITGNCYRMIARWRISMRDIIRYIGIYTTIPPIYCVIETKSDCWYCNLFIRCSGLPGGDETLSMNCNGRQKD